MTVAGEEEGQRPGLLVSVEVDPLCVVIIISNAKCHRSSSLTNCTVQGTKDHRHRKATSAVVPLNRIARGYFLL